MDNPHETIRLAEELLRSSGDAQINIQTAGDESAEIIRSIVTAIEDAEHSVFGYVVSKNLNTLQETTSLLAPVLTSLSQQTADFNSSFAQFDRALDEMLPGVNALFESIPDDRLSRLLSDILGPMQENCRQSAQQLKESLEHFGSLMGKYVEILHLFRADWNSIESIKDRVLRIRFKVYLTKPYLAALEASFSKAAAHMQEFENLVATLLHRVRKDAGSI